MSFIKKSFSLVSSIRRGSGYFLGTERQSLKNNSRFEGNE